MGVAASVVGFAKLKGGVWEEVDGAVVATEGPRRPNSELFPLTGCEVASGVFCSVVGLGAPKPNENTGLEVAAFAFDSGAADPVFKLTVTLGAGFDEGKLIENGDFCGCSVLAVGTAIGAVVAGANGLDVG